MNVACFLERAGRSFGERPALALGTRTLDDYAALANRVACMATGLRTRHRLRTGDHVAVIMQNTPAYVETLFAIWHAGLVAVPVNARLHPREFAYILEHSEARLCLTTPNLADAVGEAADGVSALEAIIDSATADYTRLAGAEPGPVIERRADDPAWLFYTSGTTGKPKGAMLSHRNLAVMSAGYFADVDSVQCTNSLLHAAPMSHGSGLYILPHVAAAAQQLIPESGGFDPDEIFHLLEHWSEVSFFIAPTMVKRMIAAAADKSVRSDNLKTVVYGGGPMYQSDIRAALERFGNHFAQIYGQAETPMTITALPAHFHMQSDHPRYARRLASVGIPQALIEVRVADDDGHALPAGETGDVQIRGDSVMLGYWRDPDATRDTIIDDWLHTGDMGQFDNDGFLTLMDRRKDLIISGGTNIYPREVEEVLLDHPAVSEAAVIGEPHPDWGESVTAFIVTAPGQSVSAETLDTHCLDRIARFKRPRRYHFVDSLPKNAYGKILKSKLRGQVYS